MPATVSEVENHRPQQLLKCVKSLQEDVRALNEQVGHQKQLNQDLERSFTGESGSMSRKMEAQILEGLIQQRDAVGKVAYALGAHGPKLAALQAEIRGQVSAYRNSMYNVSDDGTVSAKPPSRPELEAVAQRNTAELKNKLAEFESVDIAMAKAVNEAAR